MLNESGCSDAGEWLELLDNEPEEREEFEAERSRNMAQELDDQPVEDQVRHFLEWLVHTVKGGVLARPKGGWDLKALKKKEVQRFRLIEKK